MGKVLRTLAFHQQISLTVADTTQIVREAIKLHHLTPLSARILGKALSAMTFASACLKQEIGEISLSVLTQGECGNLGVSGNRQLRLRGYIENPFLLGEPNKGNEQEAFQNGTLTIIRDDGYNRPFVGSCAVPELGGVDEAFEEYFRISEQLPTRVATEVEIDENGDCVFAGVIALQALPFADEAALRSAAEMRLDEALQAVKAGGVEKASEVFFPDKTVWEIREAAYKCNCSREYLKGVLVTLGEAELRRIIQEDGAVRVHCHYCNADYEFTEDDANELFANK